MSGRTASLFVCLALVASHVPAQGFTLFFSTDGTEVAGNGTGGSASNPGNFASVFPDECVLAVTPGATASATPIATRSFYSTWFGDHDGDGDFTQGVIGNLDAVHVPANAPNPPSIFDIFVSFSRDIGPGGFQSAGMLRDGDVLRLRPQGGAQLFISEAQVTQAMGTTADIDVNGFTIDPVTGDIFWTMTTTQVVGGLTLNDGGLVRLPASSYVANADGTVASVTPNSAQIALFENELDVMYTNAGLGTVGDLDGIAIDPAGGTFTTVGGQTLPHLWFAADSSTAGASIVSSRNMGSIATRNAVSFNGGPAVGLFLTDFQGGANSSITALAWTTNNLTNAPRMLETGTPDLTTPGSVRIDVGGFTPGPTIVFAARTGTGTPNGFTPRLDLTGTSVDVPGGLPSLFITDFTDPIVVFTFGEPPAVADALGQGSRSWTLPATPPGLVLVVQAIDIGASALTPPATIVTQ